jgi:hypothetical protein
LYEEKIVNEKAKMFLNLAPECNRLHWYCMTRLGLTKSRSMEAARLLHRQYTHHETNQLPQDEEEGGLFGMFPQQNNNQRPQQGRR